MPAVSALSSYLDRTQAAMGAFKINQTQLDSSVGGSYTLRYIVTMASAASPISVVINAQALGGANDPVPQLWEYYSHKGDTDYYSYCKEIRVERDPNSATLYYVTCTFEPAAEGELPDPTIITSTGGSPNPIDATANPVNRKPRIWWDREVYTHLDVKDKDGAAIVNPVKTLYDDTTESERTKSVLVVEWNIANFPTYVDLLRKYENAVNDSAWTILSYATAPRTAVIREIGCSTVKVEGAYTYYTAKMRIAFSELGKTWDVDMPQLGRQYFTKTSGNAYEEEPGQPGVYKRTEASDLVPLNDDGTRRSDSEPILVKQWQARRTANFGALPFMSLLV